MTNDTLSEFIVPFWLPSIICCIFFIKVTVFINLLLESTKSPPEIRKCFQTSVNSTLTKQSSQGKTFLSKSSSSELISIPSSIILLRISGAVLLAVT